jgi:uncharacterized protein YcbX
MNGTVAQIWRFPVKSMRGEQVTEGVLGEQGLEGDRQWGVVDAATGKVLSAKREARLLDASARLLGGQVEMSLPDGSIVAGADPGADAALSAWLGRDVRLDQASPDRPAAYEMHVDNTDETSATIELPCPPGTFLDAAAVHLLTTASLRAAGRQHPGGAWDVRRFRPTVLVDCDGEDWVEDAWIGSAVGVGSATVMVFAPTVRCAIPTRAQDGLPRDLDIARTVNREHGANLGVYAAVTTPGPVRVGDAVEIA